MKVSELAKRDLKRNPLMVVDKSLDKFKNYPIPQYKIDSANEISKMESFKALKTEKNTRP
jgi:hypothetical protein